MNKIRFFKDNSGFNIDYIFKNNTMCLRIREDDDYFSFVIFSAENNLPLTQKVNINSDNPLFYSLYRLLENNDFIEILEEGTNEGKSLIFQKHNDSFDLIFKLTNTKCNIASISITNVRLASPSVTFANNSPKISDFKNKLHQSLLEIQDNIQEPSMWFSKTKLNLWLSKIDVKKNLTSIFFDVNIL